MTEVTLAPDRSAAAGGSIPIADYGLLSDCNSAALVSRDGSIDWLCVPRFDSPSVLARILDADAGHWSIRPAAEFTTELRRRHARHGEQLGNFPQAFSHIGLITSAWEIDRARAR
jgi:GH15 family glucan-1,4-alpha-glucosidase